MQKKISFKNNKGQKIVGILHKPNKKPCGHGVVICHGFKGYKEQAHLKSLSSALEHAGFVALRFDFTNEVGESFGKLENIKFSDHLADLKSAVDYISKQKNVDPKKIGLVGHSLGGQLVIHYAPTDKRIKAIVGLAGSYIRGKGKTSLEKKALEQRKVAKETGYFYIYSGRTKKRYKIKIDFYIDLIKHDTPSQAKKIKVPTMLLHGLKDSSVHISSSKTIYKLLKQPKKLIEIKGAPHTWRGNDDPGNKFQKKINPIVVNWFKKYL